MTNQYQQQQTNILNNKNTVFYFNLMNYIIGIHRYF